MREKKGQCCKIYMPKMVKCFGLCSYYHQWLVTKERKKERGNGNRDGWERISYILSVMRENVLNYAPSRCFPESQKMLVEQNRQRLRLLSHLIWRQSCLSRHDWLGCSEGIKGSWCHCSVSDRWIRRQSTVPKWLLIPLIRSIFRPTEGKPSQC